ncbi:hypothetical protein IME11_54 [Escherichia phage IME11]|uniref:Uncharacterized protein n=1 Tax=Escherichia phage IME11 TaxID=1239384 RepID=K4N0L0_9CAUD|nr:hypothetical protein IME11_54 [Escherichia phage IME11]AFV29103.1 hypothetical protein IME11_54 [Escherichia phage IME11]
MRKIAIGYGCGAVMGLIAYAAHLILGMSLIDLTPVMAAAIAAPLFGIVTFDFKAFSRAAAEVSNLILGRLGHRSFGSGSLCRPHGL